MLRSAIFLFHGARRKRSLDLKDGLQEQNSVYTKRFFLTGYAGNLDAYQGVHDVCSAMKVLNKSHPDSTLLIATQSPLTDLDLADRLGCLTTKLQTESDRRRVHAACDAIVVPRRIPGGIPVKMLDAMSRGVPWLLHTVPLRVSSWGDACIQVTDDRPHAIAAALEKIGNRSPSWAVPWQRRKGVHREASQHRTLFAGTLRDRSPSRATLNGKTDPEVNICASESVIGSKPLDPSTLSFVRSF